MHFSKIGQLYHKEFRQIQARKLSASVATSTLPNVELFGVRDGNNIILTYAKGGHITTELLAKGHFQRDDLLLAVKLAQSEGFSMRGTFIDVGANIGTQTIYALQTGLFTRAICFEPEPRNYRLLRANLILNGLEQNASTFQMAVSDATGKVEFEISIENIGDHRVSLTNDDGEFNEKGRARISVSRAPLDELLATAGVSAAQISMLWTDTQGHEDAVLAGASSIRRSNVPVLLELWPYALERSGGTQRLLDILREAYTHFYDLNERSQPRRRPISDLNAVVEQLEGIRNTDILVFRDSRNT